MQTTMYDREILGRAKNPKTRKDSVSKPEKTSEQPRELCKQLVEFSLRMPNAQSVALTGTFNKWDLNLMLKHGAHWKTKLLLAPGRYEYRFVVDGKWINDPNAKESRRNDFGSTNSVLVV